MMWGATSRNGGGNKADSTAIKVGTATVLAATAAGLATVLAAGGLHSAAGMQSNAEQRPPLAIVDEEDLSLEALVAPVGLQHFYEHHYQSRWLHTTAPPGRALALRRLWNAREAEMWLDNARELKFGEDVDVTLHGRTYYKDQMREPSWPRLFQAYSDDGGTLALNLKRHPRLFGLRARLSEEFGSAIGASSHLTAARQAGARAMGGLHGSDLRYDGFDALVLQTVGSKLCSVCGATEAGAEPTTPVVTHAVHEGIHQQTRSCSPHAPTPLSVDRSWPLGPEELSYADAAALDCRNLTLDEGDTLYLPAGTYHQVSARDSFSLTDSPLELSCHLSAPPLDAVTHRHRPPKRSATPPPPCNGACCDAWI